jgi:hypothetical protein
MIEKKCFYKKMILFEKYSKGNVYYEQKVLITKDAK